jgi:hypothetical protein
MNKSKLIGGIASLIWFSVFALLLLLKRHTINDLTLNEWGDLFSGFAAPLALVWLVIGYIQQGEELHLNTRALEAQQEEFRLNTEALIAQQEELKNQVAATHALVESTARQAKSTEELLAIEKLRLGGTVLGGLFNSNR